MILDHYPLPPGSCWYCGNAREGLVIDTLRDVEAGTIDHRVYLCQVCVADFWSQLLAAMRSTGRSPGLVPAERLEAAEAHLESQQAELHALRRVVQEAMPAYADLARALGMLE